MTAASIQWLFNRQPLLSVEAQHKRAPGSRAVTQAPSVLDPHQIALRTLGFDGSNGPMLLLMPAHLEGA